MNIIYNNLHKIDKSLSNSILIKPILVDLMIFRIHVREEFSYDILIAIIPFDVHLNKAQIILFSPQ